MSALPQVLSPSARRSASTAPPARVRSGHAPGSSPPRRERELGRRASRRAGWRCHREPQVRQDLPHDRPIGQECDQPAQSPGSRSTKTSASSTPCAGASWSDRSACASLLGGLVCRAVFRLVYLLGVLCFLFGLVLLLIGSAAFVWRRIRPGTAAPLRFIGLPAWAVGLLLAIVVAPGSCVVGCSPTLFPELWLASVAHNGDEIVAARLG